MSTATKRTFLAAKQEAEAFRDLVPPDTYERWEVGGSVRRMAHEIGDIEHVILPRVGPVAGAGLFAEPVNLVFARLDELVLAGNGNVTKHVYGTTGFRWGEKYRGVDFRDGQHELYCADETNFGATLAIRTGPAEFGKRLVTGLLRHKRRNKDGKVWRCVQCSRCKIAHDTGTPIKVCLKCDGTGLLPCEQIPVPDERRIGR